MGKVHPESGETYWWILPQVNTELFSRVLTDFAREFQLNRNKRVLLVLDQAGWHISEDLELPEGLELYFLPPHSPELQPAERLWPLTNETVANSSPQSIDEGRKFLNFSLPTITKAARFNYWINLFSLVASNSGAKHCLQFGLIQLFIRT